MDVGVKIGDTIGLDGIFEGSLALTTGVIGASTTSVVGSVTVDVHVIVVARGSLEIDHIVDIAAVRSTAREGSRELLVASTRLFCKGKQLDI